MAFGVGKSGTCTPQNYIFVVFKANSEGEKVVFTAFFLQNGCSGRGYLNNICIASYGIGAKFFTTNLMSADLPQNTPKTRKPIAERTSHRWHGWTPPGGAAVSAAPNNCYSSHGMHGTHRTFWQRKDSHGWHGWTQIRRVWHPCHTHADKFCILLENSAL